MPPPSEEGARLVMTLRGFRICAPLLRLLFKREAWRGGQRNTSPSKLIELEERQHSFLLNLCQMCIVVPEFVPLTSHVIQERS